MRLIFKFFLLSICLFQSITFSLGTSFLLYPQSAYELALGSHPSLGGSESVNPSLIKQKNASPIFYINSGSWLGDISLTGLNYVHKVGSYDNRLFLRQADVSDLEFRGDSPSDEPISKFSAYAFQLGSGISRVNRFGNFGIMFSYLSMGIYDQHADGFLFDIGYSKSLDNGFGMGFGIQSYYELTLVKFFSVETGLGYRNAEIMREITINGVFEYEERFLYSSIHIPLW